MSGWFVRRISALTAATHLGEMETLKMTKHNSYQTVTIIFLTSTCLPISSIGCDMSVSDTAHLVLSFSISVALLTHGPHWHSECTSCCARLMMVTEQPSNFAICACVSSDNGFSSGSQKIILAKSIFETSPDSTRGAMIMISLPVVGVLGAARLNGGENRWLHGRYYEKSWRVGPNLWDLYV